MKFSKFTSCIILLCFFSSTNAQFSYKPLQSRGNIPESFQSISILNSTNKTEEEKQFAALYEYEINYLLRGGNVIFGDWVSNYINFLADKIYESNKELRIKTEFFVLKNTIPNAFAFPNGFIFITTGLIGQAENEAQLAALKSEMQQEQVKVSNSENMLALFKDSENVKMELNGVEKSPNSKVLAFWNKETEEMKLVVDNLPVAPKGKQYQVWGIVDGVPVNMGMVDLDFQNKILAMKVPKGNIAAFAITLEKQGGNPTPTLEEMYVIGNV